MTPSASRSVSYLPYSPPNITAAINDVDALLSAEADALSDEWGEYAGDLRVDVLPEDLPQWLDALLLGRGKRIRAALAYWGFIAAGGRHGTEDYRHVIRAAAALETLHLFALVHDDVMDDSDSRRGRPSAHVEAALWHRDARACGDDQIFGRNLAILIGDLAHVLADRLADGLPKELRSVWYALSLELIAGQRADLTGAAAGRRDRSHAEHVAHVKSGRYTVMRPLQLGALAAGASAPVVEAMMACGKHLGYAFALRDDYLGVWGDPSVTGKPAGDDLFEAKATVLLSLAGERLAGANGALFARLGTPEFERSDVSALAEAMRGAGVDAEVECLISNEFDAALACLSGHRLAPDGVAGLSETARSACWRAA